MKKCSICQVDQPLSSFYRKKEKPYTTAHCKSCQAARMSRNRTAKKQALVKKYGGACSRCGYNKCTRALSFHHLDPDGKDFGLSSRPSASIKDLLKEAEKCVLLCMNCHMEKHDHLW